MHYDLTLIADLCTELGLAHTSIAGESVAVALEPGTTLRFENYISEEDGSDESVVGFEGTPSHSHGDMSFYARGQQVELNSLDLLSGALDGTVLICEQWKDEKLADRWLVHKDFVDEFEYIEPGEEIRVRRVLASCGRGDAS
jgi:hypothetical protein